MELLKDFDMAYIRFKPVEHLFVPSGTGGYRCLCTRLRGAEENWCKSGMVYGGDEMESFIDEADEVLVVKDGAIVLHRQ